MLGINLMRAARPFIMESRPSRIAQYSSLTQCTALSKEIDKVLSLKGDELIALYGINHGWIVTDFGMKYYNKKSKGPWFLGELQPKIDGAFVKACEMGAASLVHRIAEFEGRNNRTFIKKGLKDDIKLPEVKLSQIPKESLIKIVQTLVDNHFKKITPDDFEWALQQKNDAFFQCLLNNLGNEKKASQLTVKDHWLADYIDSEPDYRTAEDSTYESIMEHPRLKPFQELARTYFDQYNANLLTKCKAEMTELQDRLNYKLNTKLSIEALCDIEPKHLWEHGAKEMLILFHKLYTEKDYSSLHWISRHGVWRSFGDI